MFQIQDIFQNQWLIHHESALAYLPQFINYLKGGELSTESKELVARSDPYTIEAGTNIVTGWRIGDYDIPRNSVAVIPVNGVIMKYGYSGTQRIQQRIAEAEVNPNIIAILFYVESPGGMVSGTDITEQTILNCKKPTIGFGSGLVASAAMWIFAACNYRILSSRLDQIGSIGTKVSIKDFSGLMEKYGITIKDVYASLSTEKDNVIRELLENNNDKPLIKQLDFVNKAFHTSIQTNLKISASSEVFSGGIYFAEEGISHGLANEVNSFPYAVELAYNRGMAAAFTN